MNIHRILVAVILANSLALGVLAQPIEHVLSPEIGGAKYIQVIDMDNDGDSDIIAAGYSVLVWWENDGTGEFTYHPIAENHPETPFFWAGDLDYDGDSDIISSSVGDPVVTFRLNNGDGTFSLHYPIDPFNYPWLMKAADVDNDGDMDFISSNASWFEQGVFWWENLGNLVFSDSIAIYNDFFADQMVGEYDLGDLDNDGDLDMVWTDVMYNIYIFEFENGFEPGFTVPVGGEVYDITIDDINDDGFNDFAIAVFPDPQIYFRNTGNLQYTQTITGEVGFLWGIDAADPIDFDHDGDTDFLYRLGGSVRIFENLGDGVFETIFYLSRSGGMDMDIGDLDGDGDLDIVIPYHNDDMVIWHENTRVNNVGVSLSIAPFNSPTVIPPSGGWFGYSANITNTVAQGGTYIGQVTVYGPADNPNVPIQRYVDIQPGVPIIVDEIQHYLPAGYPSGEYLLVARLGLAPETIIAEDAFYFIKQPFPGNVPDAASAASDSSQFLTRIGR